MNPQDQLARITSQARDIAGRIGTLADAERRGLRIGRNTTVQNAQRFLGPDYRPQTTISAPEMSTARLPVVPQTTPTTPTFGSAASTISSARVDGQTPPVSTTQTERQGMLTGVSDAIRRITGQAEQVNQIREEEGLTQKRQRAQTLEKEIDELDKNFREEVKMIRENRQGASETGIMAEVARAQDKYESIRANKALNYRVASQDYQGAAEIVNEKVNALKDQNSQLLNAYQLQASLINNDLSESEQLQVQANITQKNQENAAKIDAYKSVMESAALQGAPASVYNAIDLASRQPGATAGDIYRAAGSYGADPVQRAQLAKLNADVAALNPAVGQITNPNAAQYQGLIQTVLGSTSMTKEQKASFVRSVNSGIDPFTVIKNQAKNIMGQTEATKLTNYEVARDTLSEIGGQLQQFYALGGDTNIVKGNFEKVVNRLGEVRNPQLVTLATQIQGNIQVYRNAISGTAYSEQEGRDIQNIFPGINKSETLNNAILNGRARLFDSVIDSTYRTALGSEYDVIKNISRQSQFNVSPTSNGIDLNQFFNVQQQTTQQQTPAQTRSGGYTAFPGATSGYPGLNFNSFFRR